MWSVKVSLDVQKFKTKMETGNKNFSFVVLERIQSPNEFKDNSNISSAIQKLFTVFKSIFRQK